jgi:hypothetical protein
VPLIAFCIEELLLDYVFQIEFLSTGLRWPYLVLYYVALISMVGRLLLRDRQALQLCHAFHLHAQSGRDGLRFFEGRGIGGSCSL